MRRRQYLNVCLILVLCIGAVSSTPKNPMASENFPERLSDQEFWKMTEEFSEPNGYFRSDNLLSNEMRMQVVIPDLLHRTEPGGAYLGVGPEQNFTYIAALKPRIAFITDIRRGNLLTQMMYKALFELSPDRANFVSRLFTKKRPESLGSTSTAQDIFQAYDGVSTDNETAFEANLKAIKTRLVDRHKFPLSADDLEGIEYVYRSFYHFGPELSYNSTGRGFGGRGGSFSTYADLMTQTDDDGITRGYLANEENFKVVKALEEKNLLIPLVGDFGGPKAIRAAGKYLKGRGIIVTAFYLSNVEQYLGDKWDSFCSNVASLPLNEKSTFIRASRGNRGFGRNGGGFGMGGGFGRGGLMTSLGNMESETKGCGASTTAATERIK